MPVQKFCQERHLQLLYPKLVNRSLMDKCKLYCFNLPQGPKSDMVKSWIDRSFWRSMFSKCLRPKDNTHRIRYGGQGRCIRRRDRHRGAFCVDLPVHTFEDFMRFEDELQASSAKRMTMRCLKEMGASDSRRGLKKSSIRHRSTQFCECLPFRLQPYCTSNRHMHAFIENKLDIMIVDLTFKKRFLIKDVLDRTDQLQKERELPPDLTTCLVIGYHADLAVVQVFHHSGAKFYVCNCTTRICIYKYLPCPCPYSDKTFGLCEAYFTGNGQFLVLKGNDLYFALNNSRMQALYHSYIEVAKLDEVTITSAHYTFSSMGPVNFGISPDPEKNSDIYMSLWKYRNSTPILVTNTIDVSSLLNGKSVNQDCKKCNHNRLHALNHVTITDLPKFVNIQVPRNSDYIITSTVLRYSRSSFPRAFISCTYPITADLREKKNLDKVVRTWNYESYGGSLIQIDWPKLSPSGNYSYFGDQLCLLPSHSLKSLSRICLDLLTELVLPEDVHQLPTPEIFKCLLKGVPPLEMATQQNV